MRIANIRTKSGKDMLRYF